MSFRVCLLKVFVFWTSYMSVTWQTALMFMCNSTVCCQLVPYFKSHTLILCLGLLPSLCIVLYGQLTAQCIFQPHSYFTDSVPHSVYYMFNAKLFGLRWYIGQNRECCKNGKWDAISLFAISWPWWHVFSCQSSTQKTRSDKHDNKVWLNHTQTWVVYTRVVPKIMSNFFFCMRTGNSRRRRVRW